MEEIRCPSKTGVDTQHHVRTQTRTRNLKWHSDNPPGKPSQEESLMESIIDQDQHECSYGYESLYRDCIAEIMRKDGWNPMTEVRTEYGIADLVVSREIETWVIEVKLSSDNNSMAHACGQLLFYTEAIPFTKRLVATPNRLPSFSLYKIMRLNGIELFEFTDYYFSAKSLFEKKSKIRQQINIIQPLMIELQGLITFLNDIDPINDNDTVRQWLALADMNQNAADAIRVVFGNTDRGLSVVNG